MVKGATGRRGGVDGEGGGVKEGATKTSEGQNVVAVLIVIRL